MMSKLLTKQVLDLPPGETLPNKRIKRSDPIQLSVCTPGTIFLHRNATCGCFNLSFQYGVVQDFEQLGCLAILRKKESGSLHNNTHLPHVL